jgi:hypothetical protein
MTNLSPAAQQVFWEFNRAASGKPDDWHYLPAIAAALRAVVATALPRNARGMADRQQLRSYMLAIAAELEGNA